MAAYLIVIIRTYLKFEYVPRVYYSTMLYIIGFLMLSSTIHFKTVISDFALRKEISQV